ncbi:MAG: hypothetical protein WAM91_03840 [Candidatus Acidiferrales bacterium]
MTRNRISLLFLAVLLSFCMSFFTVRAEAQGQPKPIVTHEDHHDTSAPLRELVKLPNTMPPVQGSHDQESVRPMSSSVPDPVVQTSATGGALIGATNFTSFLGMSWDGITPPDPNASIGATQIVEVVNTDYAVYSKTGQTILAPTFIDSIWSHFGGQCDPFATNGNNYADPVVLYDKLAGRWFVGVIAELMPNFPNTYTICLAVSTSSDATGSYNRYAMPPVSKLPDYDKYAVWPDAYYASFNVGGTGPDAEACAFDRSAMLAGSPMSMVCFQTGQNSMLPSDLDGSTPPPTGEPNFYLEIATTSSLNLFRFHVDFVNQNNSTFTGPVSIPVDSFSEACAGDGSFDTCIPQAFTTQQLEALGDRLMHRLAYRNFGDHESLAVNQSVAAGSSTGPRWYEIRDPDGTPAVFQQGTFAPDSKFRWMGSICMDGKGNMALGYSVSSATTFPAIGVTGRFLGDPLGVMQAESIILQPGGADTVSARWGDYTSMAIDPIDDATFLYTNEFYNTSGGNWETFLTTFKLASSAPPVTSLIVNEYFPPALNSGQAIYLTNPNSTSATATVTIGNDLSSQNVTVPANGGASVTFSVSGPAFISSASVVLAAMAGNENDALSEVNAIPANSAATQLVLNEYLANTRTSEAIYLTNPNSTPAFVTVTIGSNNQMVTVPANGTLSLTFTVSGPAFITSNIPVLAAMAGEENAKVNEVNAVPASSAATQLVLNEYIPNSNSGEAIYLSNPNSTSATVTVTIGSSNQMVTVPANGGTSVTFSVSGPAFISSNIPVLAAMAGNMGGKVYEVNAVPASSAATQLVLNEYFSAPPPDGIPIYLTNPNSTSATVTVTIGTSIQMVTVPANGSTSVTFSVSGPAFITSNIPVLAAIAFDGSNGVIEVNAFPF